jgi:hypothetical protein
MSKITIMNPEAENVVELLLSCVDSSNNKANMIMLDQVS